jgi:hypothetical protein
MVELIKENIRMERKMGMVFINGQMEENMRDGGKKAYKMVKVIP